jgi:bifunctional UDP-N-acetylglucosamine pyrophosphorylase/glucosamine-1-phosphate N-acetyltransferase
MVDTIGMALLAAGKGTRLNYNCPKPLLPILGEAMINYVLDTTSQFALKTGVKLRQTAILGYQKDLVEVHLKNKYPDIKIAEQAQLIGTADAVKSYFNSDDELSKLPYTLICCADTPLIEIESLISMYRVFKQRGLKAVVASFNTDKPLGYGRIIRTEATGIKIVEEKDCTEEQREIKEVNSGLYLVETKYLIERLNGVNSNNAANEFYLTDIFDFNQQVDAICFKEAQQFIGVNDLSQLAYVTSKIQTKKNNQLMKSGVKISFPNQVYVDWNCSIGANTEIEPGVIVKNKSQIGSNCKIGANSIIDRSSIADDVQVMPFTYIESSRVEKLASIGPYARIRPDCVIESNVKVGNFVELKKATLKTGSKASHLSYIGDAQIGERTNIGCGFITCNYDGKNKHQTIIGADCFIGSDVQMIAPVELADKCFVAAGSTITDSMHENDFAIARNKQVTKKGLAVKFLKQK